MAFSRSSNVMGQHGAATAINVAVVLACLTAMACAGLVLQREAVVTRWQGYLVDQYLAAQRADSTYRTLPPQARATSPRAQILEALSLAREAHTMPAGAQRAHRLARADTLTRRAISIRPHWGEAWTVRGYVLAQQRPAGAPETLAALRRAYAEAPFLRHAAQWRIEYGLDQWARLDAETQRRLVDEAVVYGQLNGDAARWVFTTMRRSPAYWPMIRNWRKLRSDR